MTKNTENDTVATASSTRYNEGETYVFFIPPSWLLGGTIATTGNGNIVLKDCAYLESVGTDSMIGGVAMATTPKRMNEVCTRAWPIPDGTKIREEAILIATPCMRDLKPLARAQDAEAIKKSK
jgi:hypothetical protein